MPSFIKKYSITQKIGIKNERYWRIFWFGIDCYFFVGCTTNNHERNKIVANWKFISAKNDFLNSSIPVVEIEKNEFLSDVKRITFPMAYAVQCEPNRVGCKHAVVSTEIEVKATPINFNNIKISGVLRSKIGRSGSFKSDPIFYSDIRIVQKVPDGVPVIGEKTEENTFEAILEKGEFFSIFGLAGTEISVVFE
jgi:hypothetical protein